FESSHPSQPVPVSMVPLRKRPSCLMFFRLYLRPFRRGFVHDLLIEFAPLVADRIDLALKPRPCFSSALRCSARSGSSCWSRSLRSSCLMGATAAQTLKGGAMVILPGLALA